MRVVGIGAKVRHTLIIVGRETARQAAVREVDYQGSINLVWDLIFRIGINQAPPAADIIHINTQESLTFAECGQYPVTGIKVDAEAEIWRISRAVAQTDLKCENELNIGDEAAELLVIEVPGSVGQSKDAASMVNKKALGKKPEGGWAVVKTESVDYIGSPLYDSINSLYENRHLIITSISALRRMPESPLIDSLSWESTAEGLQSALINKFEELTKKNKKLPHSVIVSIVNEGAACFSFESSGPKLKLIYDPRSIEGEWSVASRGRMAGYTQCITAAVAAGLGKQAELNYSGGALDSDTVVNYVTAGLLGGRSLHQTGFQVNNPPYFPIDVIGERIKTSLQNNTDKTFKTADIPSEDEVNWSIVKQRFLSGTATASVSSWKDIKTEIFNLVKVGIKKDSDLPLAEFDKLTAVLREEIEGVRAIRTLMQEYSGRKANKRPLSIAVFGWPGSGKSFAVKSVAKAISHSGREFDIREFNLSQFSAPDQLYEALHQVRDVSLSGKMPLVFWDEFDCDFQGKRYGWLRYFLAPMQDGKFTQGQVTHSIGDAVFVFAGGTSHTMQDFRWAIENEAAAKGPDFQSRLHGFLNITSLDHGDILLASVLIRRAVLFRGILKDYAPSIEKEGEGFDIDEFVITAFMCIPEFRYGARSMEAILTMSNLQGKNRFEASWLPPLAQVDIHVDSAEWDSLLKGNGKLLRDSAPEDPAIGW